MLATDAFSVMSPSCLDEWRLVVAKFDVGAEVGGGPWSSQRRKARRLGDVTRSSSPHLLAGAFVMEARRLNGACVERDSAPWR
jgi:hypothetical protein